MSDNDNKDKKQKAQTENVDNVIRFPAEKVRGKNKLKRLAGKLGDNRKSTLFLSFLSVLMVSAYLLKGFQANDRYVASNLDNRDPEKESALNEALQNDRRRTPASYGRKPTAEERLRQQDLNRGYQLKYSGTDGLVIEAIYLNTEDDTEMFEPVLIKTDELKDFLLKYKEAISPGYDQVKADGSNFILVKNGTPVGKAVFTFDTAGRLLSMKVQVF